MAKPHWDTRRWRNFKPSDFECPCCGEEYYWPEFLDILQAARELAGIPFKINSGHRCALHNARVGGAPLSQHLNLAVDISVYSHNRQKILTACRDAGFNGFGFYQNMLHVDLGRPRFWYSGEKAKQKWQL